MFRKRQVPRVKLNVPAWIEVGNSALLERCTLIDLSEKGARLVVGDISHLTDHFCLYLTRVGARSAALSNTLAARPSSRSGV